MSEVIGSTFAGCPKNGGVLSDSIVYFCQELIEFKNFPCFIQSISIL